jgi:hypothetical protein
MKGKLLLFLFALPFFGVGVWMGYSISSNLADSWQMKSWAQVDAKLHRAGYERHSGDDSDTYEAYAEYTYSYGGQYYTNDRVAIAGGADNVGNYQTDLGRRLSGAMSRGEDILVYVNPDNPAESIVDRSLRWGLLGFKSIFFFVFGGAGLGLMIFAFRAPKEKDLSSPEYRAKPWLANDAWQGDALKSNSKMAMYVTWGLAAFWNLISAPLPFVIYGEVLEKQNYPALLGLLFPIVGVALLLWAARRTLEWRRFGPAPLALDPFPGSIGGHVGGTIDVNLPYDADAKFSLTLTNLHSYISGSGKNRSRNESAKWQDVQIAHTSSGVKGSRLSFRFTVPEGLDESAADRSEDTYYIWRLNLKADLPGVDIDRDYDIPVYATRETSVNLSDFSIEQAQAAQKHIDVQVVEKAVNLNFDAGGRCMLFPMGRNLLGGFIALLFGSFFAGAGWYLINNEGHLFMGGIFGGVGLLIVISALYIALNSLEVIQAGSGIRTVRRILGIPVKRQQMRRADFVRFKKKVSSKSQSAGKHVLNYSVFAIDRSGQKMIVAEGLKSASQADAAMDLIAREFGLTSLDDAADKDTETSPDVYNLLAAD